MYEEVIEDIKSVVKCSAWVILQTQDKDPFTVNYGQRIQECITTLSNINVTTPDDVSYVEVTILHISGTVHLMQNSKSLGTNNHSLICFKRACAKLKATTKHILDPMR